MSKYVGKKFRSLNCMGRNRSHYESIESFENALEEQAEDNLFDRSPKNNHNEQEKKKKRSLMKSLPFVKKSHEKTRLLQGQKVKYSALIDKDGECPNDNHSPETITKKNKKNVRFADNLHEEKNIPSLYNTNGIANKANRNKRNMQIKKKSLLKRTGMMIVRSCRLMTYGAPYMPPSFPYNNRYPPDYRHYDFETGVYDYRNHYMTYAEYGPTIYF